MSDTPEPIASPVKEDTLYGLRKLRNAVFEQVVRVVRPNEFNPSAHPEVALWQSLDRLIIELEETKLKLP